MSVLSKCFFVTAWIACIGVLFHTWMDYEHNPGSSGDSNADWPVASGLRPDDRNGKLVVFLHPFCPCSRSGLKKLEWIISTEENAPTCYFLFTPLADAHGTEAESEGRRIAKSISGAGTRTDDAHIEAARFGAKTSGFIVFYDAARQLRFRGGITSERSGEQSNAFEHLLVEAIHGAEVPLIDAPVFGCPFDEGRPR